MHDFTLLLNSSVQSFCPSTFQSGIWFCFLGVPQILDPRSVYHTENPLGKQKVQWKIPEISFGSPLGLMVLSLMEVIREPIFIPVMFQLLSMSPFGQLAQNCICPCCGVLQTVKEKELLAYAVQTVCMPKAILNSKGISSTRLKKDCGFPTLCSHTLGKQNVKIHNLKIGKGGNIVGQFIMRSQEFIQNILGDIRRTQLVSVWNLSFVLKRIIGTVILLGHQVTPLHRL